MEKIIPTPSQVKILIETSQDVLCPVGEMKLTQYFSRFFQDLHPLSRTFATDPRVIESDIGLVPVELPHYPPQAVGDQCTGIYKVGYIFFRSANYHFGESIQHIKYVMSLERSFYSASTRFCYIKIYANMAEKS